MSHLRTVCESYVQNHLPAVHEVFCTGDCKKPQRNQFKSGRAYFEAMGRYVQAKAKK